LTERFTETPVVLGDGAFESLARTVLSFDPLPVLLVADEHTQAAAGRQVAELLRTAGRRVKLVLLGGDPRASADEESLARVLTALDGKEYLLAAVGSGTITDVTRFVAYQARLPYLAVPTAASVDAYTSITASITLRQVKQSFVTKPPVGVFAHLPTLCAAPAQLTAAGYGDMLAKYTALADWQIAHLLVEDACDPAIVAQAAQVAQKCADHAAAIWQLQPDGISALMSGLLISGTCMVKTRNSRPAAGAEHSLAHFWEINHARLGLPESLHGAKTGAASLVIARLYDRLRTLSRAEAAWRLARFQLPDEGEETARVEAAFGSLAGMILAGKTSFLGPLREKVAVVSERLLERWDEVQQFAAQVPDSEKMAELLRAGGATDQLESIHVSPGEVAQALRCAMYVRDRLTILELSLMLDLQS
jgi:glycerol-1-phosphate dehydrogenase [NAD(P)+]